MPIQSHLLTSSKGEAGGNGSFSSGNQIEFDASATDLGSAFYHREIDLNGDFTFTTTFSIPLGVHSEGFAFVLHNDARGVDAIGDIGGNLGAGNNASISQHLQDGLAITVDTDQWTGEASHNNSQMFDTDIDIRHSTIVGSQDVTNADFNDGLDHVLEVNWSAATRTMEWSIDGVQVASHSFTQAELDALFANDMTVTAGLTSSWSDVTFTNPTLSANFVCFCSGTRIMTKAGEVPVDDLKNGDMVLTADRGFQRLSWVGHSRLSTRNGEDPTRQCPVLIRRGALGSGLPNRDLYVSRQHRVLLASRIARRMFGVDEVFLPAFRLCGCPGIELATWMSRVDYYHLLFEEHEVVYAEGAPTESLFPGPEALAMVSSHVRLDILAHVPRLVDRPNSSDFARHVPSRQQQKRLVERHKKNHQPLVELHYTELAELS